MMPFRTWVMVGMLTWTAMYPARAAASSLDYIFLNEDQFGAETTTSDDESGWGRTSSKNKPWQFVVTPGYTFLTSDTLEGVEYINYFPYRTSNIQYSNGVGIQAGLYYQINPWFQLGTEGGYSFEHSHDQDFFDFFGYRFFVENTLQVVNATLNGKFGTWLKGPQSMPYRPFVQVGAGWYQVKNNVSFKLEGNQFLYRDQIDDASDNYSGVNAAIGVEVELRPRTVVGLQGMYHKVFKPGAPLTFIQPGLRLSYLF